MREILFRGKHEDTSEWVFGSLHIQNSEIDRNGYQHLEYRILSFRGEIDYVIPSTIGQFTGLYDKNGKRIWEGDIVKYKTVCRFGDDEDLEEFGNKHPDKIRNCIECVKWYKRGCFGPLPERDDCEDYWYSRGTYDFEVIGNIHDNPELLK